MYDSKTLHAHVKNCSIYAMHIIKICIFILNLFIWVIGVTAAVTTEECILGYPVKKTLQTI